jgi:hypothetical protein
MLFSHESENCWNCDEKHWILFSHAPKIFGIPKQHCIVFSCAEMRQKALYFVQPRSRNFGIVNKSSVLAEPRRGNFELRTKALYLFSRAAKILRIANKNFDWPRSENLLNCEQSTVFVEPRSEILAFTNKNNSN